MTWYAADALGSVRQTLDNAGAPLANASYDPWGTPQGIAISPFGFTGELQDGAGLTYLRARWYSVNSGSFLAARWRSDESNPGVPLSNHVYVYGLNNPVLYTDAPGTCSGPGCMSVCDDNYGGPKPATCRGTSEGGAESSNWYKTDWWNRDRPCLPNEFDMPDPDGVSHCRPMVSPVTVGNPERQSRSSWHNSKSQFVVDPLGNLICLTSDENGEGSVEESAQPPLPDTSGSSNPFTKALREWAQKTGRAYDRRVRELWRPYEGQSIGGGWRVASVNRNITSGLRPDLVLINDDTLSIIVHDVTSKTVGAHTKKGLIYSRALQRKYPGYNVVYKEGLWQGLEDHWEALAKDGSLYFPGSTKPKP